MADRVKAPAPAPLRQEEQDAALRSRLAFNDRPLRAMYKKISQVVGASSEAELTQALATFRFDLEAYVFQLQRIEAVAHQTTVSEVKAYKDKVNLMDQEKVDTMNSIEMLKKELVEVQQDRKNKLEYDALASEIMKYGTREELENQLMSLRTTLDSLAGESTKYSEIMAESKSRFEGIAEQLKKLRADVGFEVGERERREVEREGEGDAEEEARAGEEAVEAATAVASERAAREDEGNHNGASERKRGRSSLNPSAAVFKPTNISRDSTPGLMGSSGVPSKRRRSARRAGDEDEDEEEEEAGMAKKRAREEGEMSEGEAEEEEEEGAA